MCHIVDPTSACFKVFSVIIIIISVSPSFSASFAGQLHYHVHHFTFASLVQAAWGCGMKGEIVIPSKSNQGKGLKKQDIVNIIMTSEKIQTIFILVVLKT